MTPIRTPWFLIAAWILASVPFLAQDQKASNGVVVEGIVKVTGTGEPVKDAKVFFNPEILGPQRATNTNIDGRFVFKDIPAGRYTVIVTKNGLMQPRGDGPVTLSIEPGQRLDDIRLSLKPAAAARRKNPNLFKNSTTDQSGPFLH